MISSLFGEGWRSERAQSYSRKVKTRTLENRKGCGTPPASPPPAKSTREQEPPPSSNQADKRHGQKRGDPPFHKPNTKR